MQIDVMSPSDLPAGKREQIEKVIAGTLTGATILMTIAFLASVVLALMGISTLISVCLMFSAISAWLIYSFIDAEGVITGDKAVMHCMVDGYWKISRPFRKWKGNDAYQALAQRPWATPRGEPHGVLFERHGQFGTLMVIRVDNLGEAGPADVACRDESHPHDAPSFGHGDVLLETIDLSQPEQQEALADRVLVASWWAAFLEESSNEADLDAEVTDYRRQLEEQLEQDRHEAEMAERALLVETNEHTINNTVLALARR